MTVQFQVASYGRPVELADTTVSNANGMPNLHIAMGRGAQITSTANILSIWFVERGYVQASAHGSTISLCEGLLFVNVDAPLKMISMGDAAWIGISIPLTSAESILSESNSSRMALQSLVEDNDIQTRAISRHILQAASETEAIDFRHLMGLMDKLFQLESTARKQLGNCPGRTEKLRRLSYHRLCKVRSYIAANPGHLDPIKNLAEMANYSEGHFIRTFSKVFEETPTEYAHRLRMTHAKQLISERRLSLQEISRQVGFLTFSAFCRSFRLGTGVTPSAFRERTLLSA